MENRFIRAEDVAQELNVSKPYAYKLIRQLNEELKAKGFITIAGRVNRQYFYERLYGAGKGKCKCRYLRMKITVILVCDGKVCELERGTQAEMQAWLCYQTRSTGMGKNVQIADFFRP